MIVTLPALVAPDRSRPPSALGSASFILAERGRQHHWQGAGCLSIKSFFGGRALYEAGAGLHAVDDRGYLVLNDGQPYTILVDADEPVESFCIFFESGFAEEIQRCLLTAHPERLLDDPTGVDAPPVEFVQRVYPHDELLSPLLFSLRERISRAPVHDIALEEHLHALASRLVALHRGELRQIATIEAVRAATREEIHRRLFRAKDYADAMFSRRVTLADLARAACLSPTHLLRSFRQVFGMSPGQYLTERRLHEAARLLARSAASVTDICQAVGFESLGTFSTRFRRRFGLSPQAFRPSRSKRIVAASRRGPP